jgi:hypothetical protein
MSTQVVVWAVKLRLDHHLLLGSKLGMLMPGWNLRCSRRGKADSIAQVV